ncbi:MAG: tetratricopeptide repeat protein [Candidatus Limnocylindrales bacterium]
MLAAVIVLVALGAAAINVFRVGPSPIGLDWVASPPPSPSATPTASPSPSPRPTPSPEPTPTLPPGMDAAAAAQLQARLALDPEDVPSLQDLGDLYYAAEQFDTALTYYERILAIVPQNAQGLLAAGACDYNLGNEASAKQRWTLVIALNPSNIEAHYDLGFLAMNQPSPDWTSVKREWEKVVSIDPDSELAKNVQQHLATLRSASMLP